MSKRGGIVRENIGGVEKKERKRKKSFPLFAYSILFYNAQDETLHSNG